MSTDSSAVTKIEPLLTVDQVCTKLSMSPQYIYRLLRAGTLRGIRFGSDWRVDPHDLQAWIDRHRV